MKKLLVFVSLVFVIFSIAEITAQNRRSVSAAEVNGTFRSYFGGKFKGNYSEIKILALGGGKLRVAFNLTRPYIDGTGEMSANTGEADGTTTIDGDTAVFTSGENDRCEITIKFVRSGTIKVTESGAGSDCGFGFNVSAGGTYKKSSGAKPKFEQ